MHNETDTFGDFLTPNEQKVIADFRYRLSGGYQFQVWDADRLAGTYWDFKEAVEAANHIWEHKGFEEFRLPENVEFTEYGSIEFGNVQVKSKTDNRYMTTNTFVVRVALDSNHSHF